MIQTAELEITFACQISGSHRSGYEGFCLLRYNAVYSVESQSIFSKEHQLAFHGQHGVISKMIKPKTLDRNSHSHIKVIFSYTDVECEFNEVIQLMSVLKPFRQ
jgi:hypothetical protein